VELEDAGVHEVVPDQKSVLLALQPPILARETDRSCFFADLVVVFLVHITHVPLQLRRLFPNQPEGGVGRGFEPARDTFDGVDGHILQEERQFKGVCAWLLRAQVVKWVVYAPIHVVLDAREVGIGVLGRVILKAAMFLGVLYDSAFNAITCIIVLQNQILYALLALRLRN